MDKKIKFYYRKIKKSTITNLIRGATVTHNYYETLFTTPQTATYFLLNRSSLFFNPTYKNMKVKKLITIEKEHIKLAKKHSQLVLGTVNVSAFIGYLIEQFNKQSK